jgi:hypothetical protein
VLEDLVEVGLSEGLEFLELGEDLRFILDEADKVLACELINDDEVASVAARA